MNHLTKYTIVRYLIAGGTSACVSLGSLYFFNSILLIHYITASIFAFMFAFIVSWAFHKFWTFKERSTENMHKQGGLYLLTSLFGLSLNTLILFLCVTYVHLPVILGQVVAGGLVACCTFFISKHVVFKSKEVMNMKEVFETFL